MNNRKYIHLQLWRIGKIQIGAFLNGVDIGNFDFKILVIGQKNLSLGICKILFPGHEGDLYEKFMRDCIRPLGDFHIVDEVIDITDFCKYARDVIRIKQRAGVESIEDYLPF